MENDWQNQPTGGTFRCCTCGDNDVWPNKNRGCICSNPLMIYIPAGEHIHIQCPVHGDVKIYGSNITCSH